MLARESTSIELPSALSGSNELIACPASTRTMPTGPGTVSGFGCAKAVFIAAKEISTAAIRPTFRVQSCHATCPATNVKALGMPSPDFRRLKSVDYTKMWKSGNADRWVFHLYETIELRP